VVGTEGLDAELRRHLTVHQQQLDEYLAIEERDFPPERAEAGDRLHHLVLRAGISLESFWVAWLTEALAELPAS
jgi:hypothetical protein